MKIGFIKFGLKTYFNKSGTGQGSNHELVDVFNIFQERGHECFMLSNADIPQYDKSISDIKFDYIFVFNGPLCPGYESKMNMFQGTIQSLNYLKNTKVPWAYFWTDPRKDYEIQNHQIYLDNPPTVILSQEKMFYGHLDKLILYGKKQYSIYKEKPTIGVLMNNTDSKRSKKLVADINWLKQYQPEIRGDWKKEKNRYLKDPIPESNVRAYLDTIKYSYNINKDSRWVSQKFWEMALSGVVCFYSNYDVNNLVLEQSDFRRVVDGIDLLEKINYLERSPEGYARLRNKIFNELKDEYFNGDFMYKIINQKIKCL